MFAPPLVPASNGTESVPAPVGGLNARDSLATMPPTDAVLLENWWPTQYGCEVRKGYKEWVTGVPAQINTIANWNNITGTQKLFVWAGAIMYDVTTPNVAATSILGSLSSSYWQTVQFSNTAGTTLLAVNGIDDPIKYTSGGVGRYTALDWLGTNPKTFVQLTVHQHRLWAVRKDSSDAWFLPPDAVAGTFVRYAFGPLFSLGGYLSFLTTWTLDDGNGAEDHLVAVSSEGEAVVFAGTDPTNDQAWFLVGVYFVGAPVAGRNSYAKVGGDLFLLTQQGVVSMTQQLQSTKVNEANNKLVTEKIQFRVSALIAYFAPLPNWALKYYPKLNMLVINVPGAGITGQNIQVVANMLINSWTEFSGMNATAWGILDSIPMFADASGSIYQMWQTPLDSVAYDGSGGSTIVSAVQQAYSYLGSPVTQKQIGLYRPTFQRKLPIGLKSKIVYDFKNEDLLTPDSALATVIGIWDAGLWDSALWSKSAEIERTWISAEGMGTAVSLKMVLQTNTEVLWISTDYSLAVGSGLF